jgi:hypothetical protein
MSTPAAPRTGGRALPLPSWEMTLAVLAPLVLFGIGVASGTQTFQPFPENIEQTYAWWQHLARSWDAGYLPLWEASSQGGHSFAGEIQQGVLYPLHWLWLALFAHDGTMPLPAIEWFVILHYSIAAAGMALLLRAFGLQPVAVAVGALCFALLGPVALRASAQANIFYGLAWAPWALLVAWRYLESRRWYVGIGAGALVGLQIVAGHIQPAFHTVMLIAMIAIAHAVRVHGSFLRALPGLLRAAAWMAVGLVVIAGWQLLLASEYGERAYRWVSAEAPLAPGRRIRYAVFAYKFIFEPQALLGVVDPWRHMGADANSVYFGTLPLLFAAWFCVSAERRDSVAAWRTHRAWLIAAAAIALVAMLGHYTFGAALLRPLPLVSHVRSLARYAFLFHVVACVVAAFAVQAWLQGARLLRIPTWLAVVVVLQLIWMIWLHDALLSRAAAIQLGVALAAFAVLARWRRARPAGGLLIVAAVLAHAQAYSALGPRPVVDVHPVVVATRGVAIERELAPAYGRYRALVLEGTTVPRNWGTVRHVQTKHGYSASMHKAFFDFLDEDWSVDSRGNALLGMRYLISEQPQELPLLLDDPESGLKLYERDDWYPRVFLRGRMDLRGMAAERASGLELVRYDDHHQHFRIRAEAADEAIVSEQRYPGWCAWVNGEPAEIHAVSIDGLETPFRGVAVRAGVNDIVFEYRPLRAMLFGCD